jgi:pyridoxine kinase
MKRIVTIQDISCFGKCSLTIALPVISAMGIETCVIPTAVLSTHTGGFTGFTFRDLTGDVAPIAEHWKSLNLHFDAIYTGYLGSMEQLRLMEEFFDTFGAEDTLRFVDPVMGDKGKLYTGFTPEFAAGMAKLCAKADVIVPNLTEASFLLNEPYQPEGYSMEEIRSILKKLTGLGCRIAVLTGVHNTADTQGAMAYDRDTDTYTEYFGENLPVAFHGTGDIFSSTLVGALTRGETLAEALKTAVDYTVACIRATMGDDRSHWYGVKFEKCLAMLAPKTVEE